MELLTLEPSLDTLATAMLTALTMANALLSRVLDLLAILHLNVETSTPTLLGLTTTLVRTMSAKRALRTCLETLAQATLTANSTLATLSAVFLENALLKPSTRNALFQTSKLIADQTCTVTTLTPVKKLSLPALSVMATLHQALSNLCAESSLAVTLNKTNVSSTCLCQKDKLALLMANVLLDFTALKTNQHVKTSCQKLLALPMTTAPRPILTIKDVLAKAPKLFAAFLALLNVSMKL